MGLNTASELQVCDDMAKFLRQMLAERGGSLERVAKIRRHEPLPSKDAQMHAEGALLADTQPWPYGVPSSEANAWAMLRDQLKAQNTIVERYRHARAMAREMQEDYSLGGSRPWSHRAELLGEVIHVLVQPYSRFAGYHARWDL